MDRRHERESTSLGRTILRVMYTYGQDAQRGLLVSLHTGRNANLSADFALFREVFLGFARDAHAIVEPLVHVVVVENAYPPISARWRLFIASVVNEANPRGLLTALVTTSPLVRGVMTVVQWFVPSPIGRAASPHANFEQAARWIEKNRGEPLYPELGKLLDDARSQTAFPGRRASR
jgi:hypothetical protein